MPVDKLLDSLSSHGRDFERLCKWMLENAPEYRPKVRRVWLWAEWPGRWGVDAGVDLVAETNEGELWAVQAKHYAPEYAIRKADLDSFLSESSRAQFSYRLLVATTDHLGPTARRTLAAQEKPVGTLLRSQLDALEVEWPTSVERLRPARPKRKRPRPHQRRAISDCLNGLETADRGQLVMACGTGKTLVGPFLAEKLHARRLLVLVPSLSLLSQTLREWTTAIDFDYLAVCSDDTVTKDEQDALVASTSELGIPVTTDPERIASFLRRRGEQVKVVFATYQSSRQIATAQASRVPAFDLVIADEAHRCAGPGAGLFATVLDGTKVKARKRLFMTATPRYFTGRVKKEAKEADWEVASMDDEARFGRVLHRLTFAQAIDEDLLSDYQVVVVGVSDGEARELAERGAFVTRDGETVTDARTLARQIGLLRAMAKYDLHRVVTFHSRIDSASRFASSLLDTKEWLPARRRPSGSLWTDHVSGKMTAGERDVRLRRLKTVEADERGVLTNARCLTEGVDVPTLDAVAFIDPRRSQVDVVQAVGRAIRKAEDKTVGTIIIPVLVDADRNPEDALESSEFDRVWQIVRALRDHDDELAEELDALRRELGRKGTLGGRVTKLVLDVPTHVGDAFARSFEAKVVEATTASLEFWVGLLERFVEREGHARVHLMHVEAGMRLGFWVRNVRGHYRNGRLSQRQIAGLDALGMVWYPDDETWEHWLAAACAYREEHGDLRIPPRYMTEEGLRLGAWISNPRVARQRGTLSRTREQIAELDALGMIWEPDEENWERCLAAVRAYVSNHGDLRVPRRYVTEDGLRLGFWMANMRISRRAGTLSRNRIAELDGLGMVWEPKSETWQHRLAAARGYSETHGNLRVPVNYVTKDGLQLGRWIIGTRVQRRRGMLSGKKLAELDVLGMVWYPYDKTAERWLAAACAYREEHGDLRIPPRYMTEDGLRLGAWIQTQRARRRLDKLSERQIAELDALGMVWAPREAARESAWKQGAAAAAKYRSAHGDLRAPKSYVTGGGVPVGQWLDKCRSRRRVGRLSSEQVAELDALGMVWHPSDANWERWLAAARSYRDQQGDLRVSPTHITEDGLRLGFWVRNMRMSRRAGTLPRERIGELDALDMVWEPRQS